MKFKFFIIVILTIFTISCGKKSKSDIQETTYSDGKIHLKYWRHHNALEKKSIEHLIELYEKKNPNVKIDFTTLPFGTYVNKLATVISAGTGPHIINIHNSWAYNYVKSNRLIPAPKNILDTKTVEENFFPLVKSFKMHGEYFGLPIGTGLFGLYYNKKHFKEAGIKEPPKTWNELVEYSKKLTKYNKETGRMERSGAGLGQPDFPQGWNYIIDSLIPQNGGNIINSDGTKVLWNTKEGREAFKFYTDFVKLHKANSYLFPKPYHAFRLGRCSMMINGNWQINAIKRDTYSQKDFDSDKKAGNKTKEIFEFGIAPVPFNKKKAVYGTYWANCVTSKAKGKEVDEAWKFVKFLSSKESMLYWLDTVNELPMRKKIAQDPNLKNRYPELKAFLEQLPYCAASLKKNEGVYKLAITHAMERVVLKGYSVKDALDIAEEEINEMLETE